MTQRNDTITIMKTLAIICMVAGHSYTKSPIECFVGLFHMPVFFFCSGFCFKEKYLSDSKSYVARKLKTIWWPTFKWIVALVLLHNLLLEIGLLKIDDIEGASVHYYDLKDFAKYILMAVTLHAHAPTFAGIWFLKMLLISSVVGFFVIKYLKGVRFYAFLIFLIVATIMALIFCPGHFPIIHQIHLPFLASFFFLVGYDFKRRQFFAKIANHGPLLILLVSAIILGCGYRFWMSSMVSLNAIQCIPFCLTAIAGTTLVYITSKNIIQFTPPYLLKYMKFMGNNTYSILMMHILSFKLASIIIIILNGLEWNRLADYPTIHDMTAKGYWILYLIIGLNVPLCLKYMYYKIDRLWK